jgi:hypothetical protein
MDVCTRRTAAADRKRVALEIVLEEEADGRLEGLALVVRRKPLEHQLHLVCGGEGGHTDDPVMNKLIERKKKKNDNTN